MPLKIGHVLGQGQEAICTETNGAVVQQMSFLRGGGDLPDDSVCYCVYQELPANALILFLSSSWTAGVGLSTRYELLSSVERGALEEGWTVSVCHKGLFYSGTRALAFLPTSWICLAKLMHGGGGELRRKRYMDPVHD